MSDSPITGGSGQYIPPAPSTKNIIAQGANSLTNISQGELLKALVISQDSSGKTVIRFEGNQILKGEISVLSKILLSRDNAITLKILSSPATQSDSPKPSITTQIIAVNGKAPDISNVIAQAGKALENVNIIKITPDQLQKATPQEITAKPLNAPTQNMVTSAAKTTYSPSSSQGIIANAVVLTPSSEAGKYLPKQAIGNVASNAKNSDANVTQQQNNANSPASQAPISAKLNISDMVRIHILGSFAPKANIATGAGAGQNTPSTQQMNAPPSVATAGLGMSGQISTSAPTQENVNNSKIIAAYKNIASEDSQKPPSNVPVASAAVAKGADSNLSPNAETAKAPASITAPAAQTAIKPSLEAIEKVAKITPNRSFLGEIIGTEKSGEAVVKTPIGTIKIPIAQPMKNGTILALEIDKILPSNVNKANNPTISTEVLKQHFVLEKAVITELFTSLKSFDIELSTSLVEKTFPKGSMENHAKNQFAAKILWFLSGVKSGNGQVWLGQENVNMLAQYGKKDLLSKLDNSFANMRATLAEASPSGWNSILFPVYNGEKLNFGYLHTKRNNKKNAGQKEDIRFIIELELDDIGQMHMDGFVKANDHKNAKSLDLIIKTRSEINSDLKLGIIEIFTQSNEITGIEGSLQFLITKDFPTDLIYEANQAPSDGSIIV